MWTRREHDVTRRPVQADVPKSQLKAERAEMPGRVVGNCPLNFPKDKGGTCKKNKEGNIESRAFGPIADELWKNAFEKEPGNDQSKRVNGSHPNGK